MSGGKDFTDDIEHDKPTHSFDLGLQTQSSVSDSLMPSGSFDNDDLLSKNIHVIGNHVDDPSSKPMKRFWKSRIEKCLAFLGQKSFLS